MFSSLHKIQHVKARQIFVSVVLVFALLFSFVTHGQHNDLNVDHSGSSIEKSCQLCQQYTDKLDDHVEITEQAVVCYLGYLSQVYQLTSHSNYSVSPPLRAPPAIQ